MKLLSAIDILSPFMALAVLIGIVLCVVSLVRAMGGRRKIPYISVSFLMVPLIFFLLSQVAIVKVLDVELVHNETGVTVLPPITADPKPVLKEAMSNLYQWKGSSGTHPSDQPYAFKACSKGGCFVTNIAQDSDDPSMYWVSYEPFVGGSIPLGYTRLVDEKL
ncbi:hypothetical protein LL273_17070 [Marinobacter salarius]|uniref:hypothetical protein n=1 Tax=Marinobacter salarius TaxID=1420917 RepID=UPI001D191FBD|nr:hypothetical protein [Marinobacter salarius]MCC4285432.1 hypothetical protein [Marinobacter salarius]